MSQNPEQYNQYSQQAPSYSQAPGQPNGYVISSKDDQNMAMLAHLASAILSLLSFATASILAPLVMWFIYKDKPGYSFTKESARRAFNFNFSLWLVSMASWLLIILTFGILGLILWVVPTVVTVLMVIFHSLAAMAANRGEQYTYPMTFIEIIK
ncbi:DUF4870 domain-containing protein [Rothia mucilaginosa]|uniref:DUF4870 domain-containing protein n=1 Tax=Rothia mucilaginosa TaxID=43675 RepID=UPI0028DB7CB8|nr:DUF4870 domain-containing protein [Rothia mucilaginosa]